MTRLAAVIGRRSGLAATALVEAGRRLDRTFVLPLLIYSPTSRCNSRCVSCDWWKSSGEDDLARDEIERVAADLPALGVRLVVFSGGEPLVRPDVFEIADCFLSRGIRLHLLTSGLALERHATGIARRFERIVVSLDASTPERYRAIRGVPGLASVANGVARLRATSPSTRLTARATLHRLNFRELPALIDAAGAMGVDGISFLAADVASSAFGRTGGSESARSLLLDRTEVAEFGALVERTIATRAEAFASGFVQESPDRLRRLPRHYAAAIGLTPFEAPRCNAPWVSVVLEANGLVRPCFFHPPVGSVRDRSIRELATEALADFRKTLDVATNRTCAQCVCALNAGWRGVPWQ
jgi:MoaA/NifB/PqqE/SkfB family radical SAM enzyme